MLKKVIPSIIAILFVILFVYTGISKLIEYTTFKTQIGASPILSPIAPFLAWALPLSEFVVAILLLLPAWRLRGLYASFILMVMFTGYIVWLLYINDEIPCSCGGILEEMTWDEHLIFNIVMIILALAGAFFERRKRYLPPPQKSLFL